MPSFLPINDPDYDKQKQSLDVPSLLKDYDLLMQRFAVRRRQQFYIDVNNPTEADLNILTALNRDLTELVELLDDHERETRAERERTKPLKPRLHWRWPWFFSS